MPPAQAAVREKRAWGPTQPAGYERGPCGRGCGLRSLRSLCSHSCIHRFGRDCPALPLMWGEGGGGRAVSISAAMRVDEPRPLRWAGDESGCVEPGSQRRAGGLEAGAYLAEDKRQEGRINIVVDGDGRRAPHRLLLEKCLFGGNQEQASRHRSLAEPTL